MNVQTTKRLFFALDIIAALPPTLPPGRIVEQPHLTLAFLGNQDLVAVKQALSTFPTLDLKVGIVGKFVQPLFLPPKHPRVVAGAVVWLEEHEKLYQFQKELILWLQKNGINCDTKHDFLPHVTLARAPFDKKGWKETFQPIPFSTGSIHLYESLGFSKYRSLWKMPLQVAFEEIDHTADMGYKVFGQNLQQLFIHASIALCTTFPKLLDYLPKEAKVESVNDIISHLNKMVCVADIEVGCPFKAVSYHGEVQSINNLLEWEMIIDV